MSVLRTTPDFLAWLAENGIDESALASPPVAWGYVTLYNAQRERGLRASEAAEGDTE